MPTVTRFECIIGLAHDPIWWFKLLSAILVLLVAQSVYVYRLRLRSAKVSVQHRLSARLSERLRIARELHDNLLQGVQGLVLKFQTVTDTLPGESATRQTLTRALAQASDLIDEVHARVQGLRGMDGLSSGPAEILRFHGERYAQGSSCELNVNVLGEARLLDPIVCDDALSIGREAITNAFTHAEARNIGVEIKYAQNALVLGIRDDGKGIEKESLVGGGSIHWGIVGMRERAQAMGADLKIRSRAGSGTEIELTVPASIAYPGIHAVEERRWVRLWRSVSEISKRAHCANGALRPLDER
jgi:signal transduction histidine kinase